MPALKKTILLLVLAAAVVVAQEPRANVFPPTPEQKTEIHAKLAELSARIAALGAKKPDSQLLADLQIHKKAADYILRFPEEFFGPNYAAETIKALDLGIARANELEAGTASWTKKTGNVVRGFVSNIDGSVQPYGLTIPGVLRRRQADAARRLAARHTTAAQRSAVHQPAGRSALDFTNRSGGLHPARAFRPDEPLVSLLRRNGRVRSNRLGAAAVQHRCEAHPHPRPLDGRPGRVASRVAAPWNIRGDRVERRVR